jgi:hypothetical protein
MRLQELREQLRHDPSVIKEVYYRRPYTVVLLKSGEYTGVGTSKVCWPDRYRQEKGEMIALGKAELDLANQRMTNAGRTIRLEDLAAMMGMGNEEPER